jgi:integrase
MSLTQQIITKLAPQEKPYEVRDDRIKGFLLRVQPTGRKSYIVEYARGKRVTLGDAAILTLTQARTKAQEILGQVAQGIDPMAERKREKAATFAEFITKHYEPWCKTHHRTGDDAKRLRSVFVDLLEKPLPDLNPWLIEKHRKRRKDEGAAETTINRDLATLKAALNRAVDWGLISENPIKPVKQIKTDRTGVIRFLSPDEEGRLMAVLDKRHDHLRPMVLVSLHTGLRWGELVGLTWDDVDMTQKRLTVRGSGAKSKQTRHIPLNKIALEALAEWRQGKAKAGLVFPGKVGVMDNVNKAWSRALAEAEITDFRWHDLRHSFASKLVMAGVDLNTVRELMGHSDIKMTLRYAHLAPEHKAAAVAKLVG